MHPIRKHILFQLSTSQALPYSKLKPKDVEGNLFMYYLKQLINEGIILKNAEGLYELTLEGFYLMSKTSRVNFRVREQPLIFNMIVCQNKKGEYLLYKRLRHPFLGLVSFPYGKLHLGEKLLDAAKRELSEKTGLSGDLKFLGTVYKIINKQNDKTDTKEETYFLTHVLMHIFKAEDLTGELIEKGPVWECFWGKVNSKDVKKYNPGMLDILKLIESKKENFFEEFTYTI